MPVILAPQIRLLLIIVRVYEHYLLTYLLTYLLRHVRSFLFCEEFSNRF